MRTFAATSRTERLEKTKSKNISTFQLSISKSWSTWALNRAILDSPIDVYLYTVSCPRPLHSRRFDISIEGSVLDRGLLFFQV